MNLVISDSEFHSNSAGRGGGVAVVHKCALAAMFANITNCTFDDNEAWAPQIGIFASSLCVRMF